MTRGDGLDYGRGESRREALDRAYAEPFLDARFEEKIMKHPLSDKLSQVHRLLKDVNANALASYVREALDVLESEKKEFALPDPVLPFYLFEDGSSWYCVRHDFIDLQKSLAGFGGTIEEAIKDLFYVEGLRDKRPSEVVEQAGVEEVDSSQETVRVSTEHSQAPHGSFASQQCPEDLPGQIPPSSLPQKKKWK